MVLMDIKRSIFNRLLDDISTKEATILVGPRQVGKTFLLKSVEEAARKSGLKTAFFDLEQPSDLALFNRPDAEIIKEIRKAGDVVFIDEFHYVKNISKIVKALYDSGNSPKIYASGSSALEIHTHMKESLAGRKFLYPIFPCSLSEIAQVVQDNTLEYCLTFGGMPGTLHFAEPDRKKQILIDILQSYLLKDIKALVREENLRAFNHLLYLLAQSQGHLVVVESLAREIGLSPHTINTYLDLLAQTYVSFPLHSYSKNLGNELKKSRKFYLYDLGLRNSLLKNFAAMEEREDAGTVAESFVFLELQKRLTPEAEIRFWRLKSGEEVDLLWIHNQVPYPIEVKLHWESPNLPSGLNAFLRKYPKTRKAFVVSTSGRGHVKVQGTEVEFLPLEETSTIPRLIA